VILHQVVPNCITCQHTLQQTATNTATIRVTGFKHLVVLHQIVPSCIACQHTMQHTTTNTATHTCRQIQKSCDTASSCNTRCSTLKKTLQQILMTKFKALVTLHPVVLNCEKRIAAACVVCFPYCFDILVTRHVIMLRVVVCVCMCARARARVCVCVCM